MTRVVSKVKPHPYVYDAELSRGSGRRICGTCGLPGRPGDNRHTSTAGDYYAQVVDDQRTD